MQSDGQLYDMLKNGETDCPSPIPDEKPKKSGGDIVILGLLALLMSDKTDTDLPLVLALAYILLGK